MGICDICKKPKKDIESIILSKRALNYCPKCEKKAMEIKEAFEADIYEEYFIFEWQVQRIEKEIFDLL